LIVANALALPFDVTTINIWISHSILQKTLQTSKCMASRLLALPISMCWPSSRRPKEDGEQRFRLYGMLDDAAHCAVVTLRDGVVRAISLRKANRMERKRYDLRS